MIEQSIGVQKRRTKISLARTMSFPLQMGILVLLIIIKNVFDAPIPVSLLLGVGILIALLGEKEEIIMVGICCIPLAAAFQYKYLLLACVIIYFMKYTSEIKLNKYILPVLCMMIWELMHYSLEGSFTVTEYFRGFAEIIFCSFLVISAYKEFNYARLCRILAVCTVCVSVIVLLNVFEAANYNFEVIFDGYYRLGEGNMEAENFGVNFNANELGFICLLSITGLMQLIVSKQHKRMDFLLIIVLLFFVFLTMSRAALLTLAFLVVLLIFSVKQDIVGRMRILLIAGVLFFILILCLYYTAPYILEQFIERFQVRDVTGGRSTLFEFYNKHIFSEFQYMFFGVGMQDVFGKIKDIYGITKGTTHNLHNGTQEIIVAWGLPGFAMFLFYIGSMITASKTTKKRRGLIHYLPLMVIGVFVQSIQLLSSGICLLSFAVAYVSLCTDFEKKNVVTSAKEEPDELLES